jgi:hypothetical protein
MAGSNEITRHLWEIVQNSDTTTREKTNALSCLMQSYNSRLQTLTSCPESYMNIKKSLLEIDLQRLVDSSPVLKAQVNQRKLFQKHLFNSRSDNLSIYLSLLISSHKFLSTVFRNTLACGRAEQRLSQGKYLGY